MQRIAFQLRIRAGKEAEYDETHRHVWPELLAELESFEVTDYSIFRRGQELFLYLRVPDISILTEQLNNSEVNRRWQEKMAPVFEPVPSLRSGEALAFMDEVFFLPGRSSNGTLS